MTIKHLTLEGALIFTAKSSGIDFDFSPCLASDGNSVDTEIKAYHTFWPEDPSEFFTSTRTDLQLPDMESSSSFFSLYQIFRKHFSNGVFQLKGRIDSPLNELKEIPSSVAYYLEPHNEDWSELVIISESNGVVEKRVVYGYYFTVSVGDDEVTSVLNRGGRPPTYDWQRIADILEADRDNDGLSFRSQSKLFVYISSLCEKLHQQSPESRTIKNGLNKIDPELIDSMVDR